MNIVKVYTQYGRLLATYPDAVAVPEDDSQYVFETGIDLDDWDFGARGNWIACVQGPLIVLEERQSDANSSSVSG